MSNVIDISSKITNVLPVVKISEDIVVTVNNRKSTILSIKAKTEEMQRKADTEGAVEYDEMKFMSDLLAMLIGQKNADAIEELDLPLPEYKELYESIMNIATGTYGTTPTK